ncbi:TRAP transporter substrate-binding protein [Granulosicoccus sp. 3-233]|uniref:TRAP transporter substrate-binding protein n=1 Tax=Granulosicoccus sp. 3-233 TaxID=3417969 RepID=UPI003D34B576
MHYSFYLSAFLLLTALPGHACENTLKLNVPSNDPDDLASAELFESVVEDRTDGETCVELFPSSSLYESSDAVTALSNGLLELSIVPTNQLHQFGDSMYLFQVPFLFRDSEILHDFMMSESSAQVIEPLTENGLVPITFWSEKPAQIYSDSPVTEARDLARREVRVMNASGLESLSNSIGFSTSAVGWKDLWSQFNIGQFSAFETTISSEQVYGLAGREISLTFTNHSYDASFLIISRMILDSMDDETREIVLDAGKLSGSDRKKRGCEKQVSSLEEAQTNGMTIWFLSDDSYKNFRRIASSGWDQLVNEDVLSSVDAFCPECAGTAPRPKPKCE